MLCYLTSRILLKTTLRKHISFKYSYHAVRGWFKSKCNHKNNANNTTSCFVPGIVVALGVSFTYYIFHHKFRNSLASNKSCELTLLPCIQAAKSLDYIDTSEKGKTPRSQFNFLADVAEKTAPSVVYVEIVASHPITRQKIPISNGSGFVVKSDGLILTNAHVVSYNGRVNVKLYDGQEFEGFIESFDTESDLATVRIKATNLPVLPLGSSSNLRPGEFVIAMGNPLTLSHTITAGVISSANRRGKDLGLHKKTDYIQTDAAVNVGNSGGPLVNLDGEAIGINTMKVTEGISFAVPSDRAIEFLKKTEKTKGSWIPWSSEKVRQKYLGITMLTLTPTIIQELQQRNPEFPDVKHGVLVWRVMIGSPSYESGIKHGDIITAINKKEIYSASDIYNLLKTEDILQVHVVRMKKEFDITVKLVDPIMP